MKTITYDDTLYQLVPKMLQLNLKDFLAIANKHPDIVGAPVYYAVYPAPDESLSAAPTPPAQPAERMPLTDDQIDSACMGIFGSDYAGMLTLSLQRAVARAIEAAHGIKE